VLTATTVNAKRVATLAAADPDRAAALCQVLAA
jgi:hypothetical protein